MRNKAQINCRHRQCYAAWQGLSLSFLLFHLVVFASIIGLVSVPTVAHAELCADDRQAAATLLVPYFEVDFGDSLGVNTVFSVNNASSETKLVNVTLWTDLSVPTLRFNLYLTGYDVQRINLRDIFAGGVLPQTAASLSNQGASSGMHVDYNNCSTEDGTLPPARLSTARVHGLQQAHTGKASIILGNQCAARDLGDNIARGYVTADLVLECSTLYPSESGYFSGGSPVADGLSNALWGDYTIIDPVKGQSLSENAVHIESDQGGTFMNGDYTFYGRYVSADSSDRREPLGTVSALRYLADNSLNTTRFLYWRDSGLNVEAFACDSPPDYAPLGHTQVLVFDEEENSAEVMEADKKPFAAESGSVEVGGTDFPIPFSFGWAFLNLNTTVSGGVYGAEKQSHLTAVSRFTTGSLSVAIGADAFQTSYPASCP